MGKRKGSSFSSYLNLTNGQRDIDIRSAQIQCPCGTNSTIIFQPIRKASLRRELVLHRTYLIHQSAFVTRGSSHFISNKPEYNEGKWYDVRTHEAVVNPGDPRINFGTPLSPSLGFLHKYPTLGSVLFLRSLYLLTLRACSVPPFWAWKWAFGSGISEAVHRPLGNSLEVIYFQVRFQRSRGLEVVFGDLGPK